MYTTREAAEKLDADPGTIRMWCINGTFKNAVQEATARGPVWMIPETDLERFSRRGRGRPSQYSIFSPIYERLAAMPEWAEMSATDRARRLLDEIQKENAEKRAAKLDPYALPPGDELGYARRIIAALKKYNAPKSAKRWGNKEPARKGGAAK